MTPRDIPAIMAAAAPHLKGLSMELGGKSPCVIFADADLDRAIDSALFGVFSLNGERCTAGSRILAERTIYPDLVTRLATRAERIRVGDPADPETEIGALVGGVKASGLGREGGAHSLDFYTESRIVHVPLADPRVPRFGA